MSPAIVSEALWRVTAWGLHDRWRRVGGRRGRRATAGTAWNREEA
jgi:hypothetical protein